MPIYKRASACLFAFALLAACGGGKPASNTATGVTSMKEVPAVRLNFRYEGDVPAPQTDPQNAPEERNQAVQGDFDTGRAQDEILDKTISSPNKQSVLAVWHRAGDAEGEFRLDMYDAAGHLQKRLTADSMSAKFPDTIRWSPDSTTLAFVACSRTIATTNPLPATAPTPPDAAANATDANTAPPSGAPVTGPTPAAPTGILAFRTEQIYTANADGSGVKALTGNEGLKYFYYAWSPDSSMLAALATTRREWQVQELATSGKGEEMIPYGRPRIIEKNGRERRLDDAATQVQPVWSPDSAKIAVAYGNQIRVYDALGTGPTQAAVPLRNQLLISSQAYDEQQKTLLNAANANTADANANANSNAPAPTPTPSQSLSVLPDEKTLVSYNPIVALAWPQDDVIYMETAYVKRMKNAADNVTSFARWHRLVLSAQPAAPVNK
jgi:Tol biopolymer transport system component